MLNTLIVKKTNMYTSHALIYTNASVSKTFLLSPIQTNISLFKRSYPGSTPKLPKINPKLKENQASDSNIQNKFNLPTSEILQPFENESEVSKYLKTTNIPCQNQTQMENSTSQNNTAVKDNKPTIPSTNLKTLSSNDPEFQSLSSKVSNCNINKNSHNQETSNSLKSISGANTPIITQNITNSAKQALTGSFHHLTSINPNDTNSTKSNQDENKHSKDFTSHSSQSDSNSQSNSNLTETDNTSSLSIEAQHTKILFDQLLDKKLIEYEDTKELKNSGNLRLTHQGYKLYSKIHAQPLVNKTTSDSDVLYEVGILKADLENTIILLPSQTHLIVAFDSQNNTRTAIGFLTSENSKTTTKLSNSQPISDDPTKAQYIKRLRSTLNIENKDFSKHEKATFYIQDKELYSTLDEIRQEYTLESIPYNGKGVDVQDLQKLLDLHEQEQYQKIKKTKPSNFITDEEKQKYDKKQEKAVQNKIKQKEAAEKYKLFKQVESKDEDKNN